MRSRGPRLGELLERRGALGRDQLLRALRNQKVVGGKLGTCLLEIDALPEEKLLEALAEQQNAPSASPEDLRGVARPVLALVPGKVARAHLAVPFRSSGTQIHVAMVDTRDLRALDELAFVTGRRVLAHVACEARLLEALDRYYAVECPQRFAKLLDRLNRARFLWAARESAPPAEQLQWEPGLTAKPAPTESLVTEMIPLPPVPSAPPAPPPPATRPPHEFAPRVALEPPAPPKPPAAARLSLETAEQLLLEPQDKDAVAATLVEFAAQHARAVALFQVRKEEVTGWTGRGVDARLLSSFRLPLLRPSLFVALRDGASIHRGPIPDLTDHARLRELFGAGAGGDLAGLPMHIRERLVAVLLVAPSQSPFDSAVLAEIQRIAAKAAIALELCIMRKKLRKA